MRILRKACMSARDPKGEEAMSQPSTLMRWYMPAFREWHGNAALDRLVDPRVSTHKGCVASQFAKFMFIRHGQATSL